MARDRDYLPVDEFMNNKRGDRWADERDAFEKERRMRERRLQRQRITEKSYGEVLDETGLPLPRSRGTSTRS